MVRNPIFIGFTRVKGLDTILGKLSALFNGGLLLVNINRMSVFYTQKRAVVTAYLNRKGSPSLFEEDKGGNSAKLLGKTMTEADKMVENGAISFGKDPKNGSRLSFKLYIQSVF